MVGSLGLNTPSSSSDTFLAMRRASLYRPFLYGSEHWLCASISSADRLWSAAGQITRHSKAAIRHLILCLIIDPPPPPWSVGACS